MYEKFIQQNKQNFLEIYSNIEQAENILMVVHKNPDGDALGCLTAMMEYLAGQNKQYVAFCIDGVPGKFQFLKNSHQIISEPLVVSKNRFDLIIVMDCSTMDYTGLSSYLKDEEQVNLINIDHHVANCGYGHINLVHQQSCSTAALLYKFFEHHGINISKEIANSLLTGILTDTSNFTNKGTTSESFAISADLIRRGANCNYINKQIYQDKSRKNLQTWGKILSRLVKNDKLKIAYSIVLREDVEDRGEEAVEGISNFFNKLSGVKIAVVLKEKENGEVKVSLRAIGDDINLLPLVKFFNGGGHSKAAGFLIQGRLEQVGGYWQII